MKKFLKSSYMALVMLIIYVPIFILILFSFNSSASLGIFSGFSTKWYKELFAQEPFIESIAVSLFTAIVATIVSTIIGTLAAIGLTKSRRLTQKITLSITNIPLINADVITAVALMLIFIVIGLNFGTFTLILAHISFDIPYVIMTVLPRLKKVDHRLIEASLDLGAKPSQTLRKVILPILKPAIISGAAIAFAMSFDDFIISYFTGGADVNVSTFIYTMKRIQPFVNSFGTICIVIISAVVIGWNGWVIYKNSYKKFRQQILKGTYKDKNVYKCEVKLAHLYHALNKVNKNNKPVLSEFHKNALRKKIIYWENKHAKLILWIKEKKTDFINDQISQEKHTKAIRKNWSWFVRSWKPIFLVILALVTFGVLTAFYIESTNYDLLVANWGSYIDPKLLVTFEKQYGVKVKYSVYDSNESLYNKLPTAKYDVMVPSDYMVNKMANEKRLQTIDYDKLNTISYGNGSGFIVPKPNDKFSITAIPKGPLDYQKGMFDAKWTTAPSANAPAYYQDFYNNYYDAQNDTIKSNAGNKEKVLMLSNTLLEKLNKPYKDEPTTNIADYSIPYFWGSVSVEINPSASNINLLKNYLAMQQSIVDEHQSIWSHTGTYGVSGPSSIPNSNRKEYSFNKVKFNLASDAKKEYYSDGISWDLLWYAAKQGKKVLLNDDYRNIFMLANEKEFYRPVPKTKAEIETDANDIKQLLKYPNVSLMNDEIINSVGDGNFDLAFMYNGDAISADQIFADSHKTDSDKKIIIVNPNLLNATNNKGDQEGTNIWSDNIVISKHCRNTDLAYKFISFLLQHQNDLSEYTGYTSPFQQVINYENDYDYYSSGTIPDSGAMLNYTREYIPVSNYNSSASSPFYYSLLSDGDGPFILTENDDYMVNLYNQLIAEKH